MQLLDRAYLLQLPGRHLVLRGVLDEKLMEVRERLIVLLALFFGVSRCGVAFDSKLRMESLELVLIELIGPVFLIEEALVLLEVFQVGLDHVVAGIWLDRQLSVEFKEVLRQRNHLNEVFGDLDSLLFFLLQLPETLRGRQVDVSMTRLDGEVLIQSWRLLVVAFHGSSDLVSFLSHGHSIHWSWVVAQSSRYPDPTVIVATQIVLSKVLRDVVIHTHVGTVYWLGAVDNRFGSHVEDLLFAYRGLLVHFRRL